MTQVGVKAFKDSLSERLHRVSEGERIVIPDRGRPVALLSRVDETRVTQAAWRPVEGGMAPIDGPL